MPNWCDNRVCLLANNKRGNAQIKKFLKSSWNKNEGGEYELDYNGLIPSPDWDKTPNDKGKLPKQNADGFMRFPDGKVDGRWYEWNCDNWGTKWNASNSCIDWYEEDDSYFNFTFCSPWGSPWQWVEKLVEVCPDTTITLQTSGEVDSRYYIEWKNGITVCEEDEGNYDWYEDMEKTDGDWYFTPEGR
tara:strand:+ start:106 stop:669 length:564 start_codon:yes stop_codon:yes gene_type:complete